MEWVPALILIIPATIAALAAWRPGTIKVLAAVLVTVIVDGSTYFAFWLQGNLRTGEETIKLILFVAVPAGLITLTTLLALARCMTRLGQSGR
jgi:hypothetical protein